MQPVPAYVQRTPSGTERRVFATLTAVYALLLLAVLPVATLPSVQNAHVAAVSGLGVLFADGCTALLLGNEYRRTGRLALLYLTCAYVYSGLMAALHVLTFPGAIYPAPLIGNLQTVSWLFAMWRAGTALLLFLGVLAASSADEAPAAARSGRLATALGATVAACVVLAALFSSVELLSVAGNAFMGFSLWMNWGTVALYLAGAALIWRRRAFNDALFLWLAVVLVASATDLALTSFSGARYTLGWYIGRASWVISASLLLLLWLTHESSQASARLRSIASYGSALCVLLALLLLHWFLLPWLGPSFPFATTFAAVAIAVWLGGWRPAVVVGALGYIASDLFFLEPVGQLNFSTPYQFIGFGLYLLTCAVIIGLGEAMRRARDGYRASEQRFRRSQEASIQGYAMLRAVRDGAGGIEDFEFQYINPRGARLASRPAGQIIGARLTEVLPGARKAGLLEAFRRVTERREPVDSEIEYEDAGRSGWFRHMIVPLDDGVAVSYSDITETRRLQQELRQRASELQQADTNKSHFLAVLSHELRNPMAPIRNALALLGMSPERHTIDKVAPIMERQLGHLTRLIDDLLDISRIDRGKLEMKHERAPLDAVVKNALETAKPNIEAKSHEVVVRFPADPVYVHGDVVRLTQVVSNLLNNAAKFTPPRGSIEIALKAEGGEAAISVADNGIGIPPDELGQVFGMFVQLDAGRAAAPGGLGLGLTLARSIAEVHGGTLEAHSAGAGKGSRFVLRLPVAPSPPEAVQLDTVSPRAAGRTRILVVDDNEDAAATLAAVLRFNGHEVRTAFDGEQGLRQAREFRPEVAFIDLNMPVMDGLALAGRLHADPATRRIRLIAVTGMGQQADIARTRAAGFIAHLTKPASPEEVLRLAARAEASVIPLSGDQSA